MSEQIDNSKHRKARLKELILRLHSGASQEDIKQELLTTLGSIPYGEVVEVEQALIEEGLPIEEVLKLCDAHSSVLKGQVDLSAAQQIPPGHPIDILIKENIELLKVVTDIQNALASLTTETSVPLQEGLLQLTGFFNLLTDVDKHYQRKEYLLFPYLEKSGVTGPPKVMWGKHDEIRELLKGSLDILKTADMTREDFLASSDIILQSTVQGIADMTVKEEQILFPMLMDALSEADWYEIQKQSLEIGFCLYDPPVEWFPEGIDVETRHETRDQAGRTMLPSGGFSTEELLAILNTLPIDITFVDKDDKVKYFSQSRDRIFQRSRAILNRDVRHCHPPASAHIVDKILEDFKSGKQERAPFWINMGGKFIHIEYFALRNDAGAYLGTLEVSQDLTHYRALAGEQRILSYAKETE